MKGLRKFLDMKMQEELKKIQKLQIATGFEMADRLPSEERLKLKQDALISCLEFHDGNDEYENIGGIRKSKSLKKKYTYIYKEHYEMDRKRLSIKNAKDDISELSENSSFMTDLDDEDLKDDEEYKEKSHERYL